MADGLGYLSQSLHAGLFTNPMILRIKPSGVPLAPIQLIGSLPFLLARAIQTCSGIFDLRTGLKPLTAELALMHLLRQHWKAPPGELLKFRNPGGAFLFQKAQLLLAESKCRLLKET